MNKVLKSILERVLLVLTYRVSKLIIGAILALLLALLGYNIDEKSLTKIFDSVCSSTCEEKPEPIPLDELFLNQNVEE